MNKSFQSINNHFREHSIFYFMLVSVFLIIIVFFRDRNYPVTIENAPLNQNQTNEVKSLIQEAISPKISRFWIIIGIIGVFILILYFFVLLPENRRVKKIISHLNPKPKAD